MNNMHANPVGSVKKDIYIIRNDINNKVYIGQSLNSKERFASHCKRNNDNSLIDKAIQKYGKEHFYYEILEEQITNYNEQEKYWIKYFDCLAPKGYNILEGWQEPPRYTGDNHPSARISNETVKEIAHELKDTTLSLLDIAKKFNISKKQVLRINQGTSRYNPEWEYPLRKEPNINGKLTEEMVDGIIDLLEHSYLLNGEIARRFQVKVHTISDINQGYSHRRDYITYPIREWKSAGPSTFTYEEVTDIINRLLENKESISSIARSYKVSTNIICNINTGTSKRYRRKNLNYPLRKY